MMPYTLKRDLDSSIRQTPILALFTMPLLLLNII